MFEISFREFPAVSIERSILLHPSPLVWVHVDTTRRLKAHHLITHAPA